MRQNLQFEMPYGRAWFLRLASEHRALFGNDLLLPMANDLAESLLHYLESTSVDLRINSYGSHSWALINLIEFGRVTNNQDFSRRAEQLAAPLFNNDERVRAACSRDLESGNFMAVCSNALWLASLVMEPPAFARTARDISGIIGWMRPILAARTAHENGLNFSRAWGLWHAYSVSNLVPFVDLYSEHVRASLGRRDTWDGDYATVSHWVAQFGVLAIYPLLERR